MKQLFIDCLMDNNGETTDQLGPTELPLINKLPSGRNQIPRRKFSFPAVLTVPTEQIGGGFNTRRRFSNVGDAVSRKLSTTIGWRSAYSPPPQEVIIVGRALCSLYVRSRLKRAGVFNRKLGLSRLKSTVGSMVSCATVAKDVFPCLNCAGAELERMHPKLYCNIARHVLLPTDKLETGASSIILSVGHQLFRSDPTWGKVVAVFSVAGGLAVDCVRSGHPEYLNEILEGMTELLEERVAEWIAANGGWNGLNSHCRSENQDVSVVEYSAIFILMAGALVIVYFLARFLLKLIV